MKKMVGLLSAFLPFLAVGLAQNPSIEVHTVDRGLNTGAAVILVPGGGTSNLAPPAWR